MEFLFSHTLSTALRFMFAWCLIPHPLSHTSFRVPPLAKCPNGGIKRWALYKWHLQDPLYLVFHKTIFNNIFNNKSMEYSSHIAIFWVKLLSISSKYLFFTPRDILPTFPRNPCFNICLMQSLIHSWHSLWL